MPKKTVSVSVSGLATQPNDLSGVAVGSMAVADNVVFRRPGELEPALKQVSTSLTGITDSNKTVLKSSADALDNYVSSIIRADGGTTSTGALIGAALQVQDPDTGDALYYTGVQEGTNGQPARRLEFYPGRSHTAFSRDRRIYTGERAPVTLTRNTADSGYELRIAGLQAPGGLTVENVTSPANPVVSPANTQAYYRATFFRKYPKYDLMSAPTAQFLYRNITGVDLTSLTATVNFDQTTAVAEEFDYVVLYRTAYVDQSVDPGDLFQEVTRYILQAADLVSGSVTFDDLCPDAGLGVYLYTNSNSEGAFQANYPPPDSRAAATYNDTTFYVANQDTPTMSFGISDFGSINGGAVVGSYSAMNSVAIVAGDHFAKFAGDLTSVLTPGMVMSGGGMTGYVASVSYSVPNTTVTMTPGLFGLSGTFSSSFGIGAVALSVIDTILFNYTLYDTSVVQRIWWYGSDNPWTIPLDMNNSALYNTFGVNVTSLSAPTSGLPPSVSLTLSVAQVGRIKSFFIDVTHGSSYVQMDGKSGVGGLFGRKASVQNRSGSRLAWSKTSLPEAVAIVSYLDVGHGSILRVASDDNALYAACTDGVYRITGSGDNWVVTQLTRTARLVHPDAMCSLNGNIVGWFTDGVCLVSASGVAASISDSAIGPALEPLAKQYVAAPDTTWGPALAANDLEKEVYLFLSEPLTPVNTYVFNARTSNWCTRSKITSSHGAYVPGLSTIYFPGNVADLSSGDGLLRYENPDNDEDREDPEIRPNIFTAGAPGVLKQWIDLNLLVARDIRFFAEPDDIKLQFLFEDDAATAQSTNYRFGTVRSLQRLHCWVPKRCAVQDTLKTGFVSLGVSSSGDPQSVYFRLQGFAIRYRVSSETFQK